MTATAFERLRPWLGSLGLHALLVIAVAAAAINWRSTPPPQQLAIEGSVVRYEDLPASVRSGKPLREPRPVPPAPAPRVEPEPAPAPPAQEVRPPEPDPAVEQRRVAEQAAEAQRAEQREQELKVRKEKEASARLEAERKAEEQRKAAEQKAAEQKAEQARKTEEEARKAEEARSKAAAEREARQRAARESELQRALAMEEEGEAFARSGVVDEYRAVLVQTIERNWIKPPSARPGLECTLNVTQAAGGTVLDVKLGACNGDAAVRESVANAVYRSSPLPAPRDPRAFQRQLVIVFKPTE